MNIYLLIYVGPIRLEWDRMAVIDDANRDSRTGRDLTLESYEAPTSFPFYL